MTRLTKYQLAVYTVMAENNLDKPFNKKQVELWKQVKSIMRNNKSYIEDRFRIAAMNYQLNSAFM